MNRWLGAKVGGEAQENSPSREAQRDAEKTRAQGQNDETPRTKWTARKRAQRTAREDPGPKAPPAGGKTRRPRHRQPPLCGCGRQDVRGEGRERWKPGGSPTTAADSGEGQTPSPFQEPDEPDGGGLKADKNAGSGQETSLGWRKNPTPEPTLRIAASSVTCGIFETCVTRTTYRAPSLLSPYFCRRSLMGE